MARDVALFVTCLTDQFHPAVGVAITKTLEALGCRVHFPTAQTCCGQPFYNNGYHDEAAKLARRFVEVFEPYPYVVTPSGSCCAMVREQFPRLLGDDPAWKHDAKGVVSRTFEYLEFLDKVLKVDFRQFTLKVPRQATYHYSCHLRGLGVGDLGERVLRQMGQVDFRPLHKADQCCGFGGTFAVKYPAISGSIVADKADCIAATGATTLVSNDAGCTMNIAGMCRRKGLTLETRHVAELIAEAMGLATDRW